MITQAATKIKLKKSGDERVIPLHRHSDLYKILNAVGVSPGHDYAIIQEGYIDHKGDFYSRREAAAYMRTHGQKTRLGDFPPEELTSEDLY